MDKRALTPVEAIEIQERVNPASRNSSHSLEPEENPARSPEPESGIGKDVDSCEMDPSGDLGKGDAINLDSKPQKDDDIMDLQPSPNSSEAESDAELEEKTQVVSVDKPRVTSKPPRFDNTVEPISYEVPMPRAPRGGGGGFGRHVGRGPRKAVIIIIAISVFVVALVVGLVLAADVPPDPDTARLYGFFETNNILFRPAFNQSTWSRYRLIADFEESMEAVFYNTSFERAYNNTEVKEFGENVDNYLTVDFMLGLIYYFDNDTTISTATDEMSTAFGIANLSTLPMVTTTASMETTTKMPLIDDDTPLWVANIIYFVYDRTMGKLGNFTGTLTLSYKDPDTIMTSTAAATTSNSDVTTDAAA
ncbi:uncharacterized protein [Amphiura filiformis]|uniref:uncharacterized protein isoform X2 n=1 Tax=Amphiura filiformis TaxID=82378 RepID=UPI003B21264E